MEEIESHGRYTTQVTALVPVALAVALDHEAIRQGTSRAQMIRTILEAWRDEQGPRAA